MDNLLKKLLNNEIKLKDIDNTLSPEESQKVKLKYIEALTKKDLSVLGLHTLDASKLRNKNIENFIGSIELPLGIAGPINIKTKVYSGTHFLPIATTEGALVASISRGCKALTSEDNSVFVKTKYLGATRAPLFITKNISECVKLEEWINKNVEVWKSPAEKANEFTKIIGHKIITFGNKLWLRINFDTDEAMGMNMATIATSIISDIILKNNKNVALLSLTGNLCSDKKPAMINALEGRGYSVEAEIFINEKIIEKHLHTTGEKICEINRLKVWYGSALAGSLGFNSHTANIIAGIFAATGQDIAHTVDSSINYVSFEKTESGVLANIKIPALMIGTIGGGTRIAKQSAAVELMLSNINGRGHTGKKSELLAGLVACGALAGEISLHAALVSNNFVCAHKNLGQGKQ